MAKKRVGIIGCGAICPRHIEAINANSNHFSLVAVCDIDQKKASVISKEKSIPGFTDYKVMLKKMKGKMDIVTIATPNSLHFQQAKDAINSGYSIIVEKPVDFSHRNVQTLSKLAEEKGVTAYCVLQVRFNPTLQILKEALSQKILGKIRSISLVQRWQRPEEYFVSWRADQKIGGRTLYEVGIHYLDILQWMFGVPKVISSATFSNKHTNISFEDTAFSLVQYPEGASGSIEVTIASEPSNLECSISVMGSEGYVKIGGRALDRIDVAQFLSQLSQSKWNDLVSGSVISVEPNSYGNYLGSCPNHPSLYKAIANGCGIKLSEASHSIKFIESIYKKEYNAQHKN